MKVKRATHTSKTSTAYEGHTIPVLALDVHHEVCNVNRMMVFGCVVCFIILHVM